MPEIQDIDDFKNDLLRLGNEPEIREKRGESMPEISVPESGPVDDLSALFDDSFGDVDTFDESGLFGEDGPSDITEGPEEAASEDDFDTFETEDDAGAEDEVEDIQDWTEDDFSPPPGLTEGLDEELGEDTISDELDELPDQQEDVLPEVPEPDDSFETDNFDIEDFPEDSFDSFEPDSTDETGPQDEFLSESESGPETGADSFDFDTESLDSDLFDAEGEDIDIDEEVSVPDTPENEPEADMFDTSDLDSLDFESEEGAAVGEDAFETDISDFEEADSFDDGGTDDEPGSEDDFSLEDFSLGEIDGDDIEASEFSLGDLGEEFGIDEEASPDIGKLEEMDEGPVPGSEDFSDAYSDDTYAIPDDEYIELKKTLGRMPRNLKLMIEELIGEKQLSGENLDKLVQALIRGSGAREIGSIVSKITGKKVKIPAQYEKRAAEDFEKEKTTFGYIFRKNFIPMFRTASIVAVLLGLLLFLGYRFVYTPVHAEGLYRKGYEEITAGDNSRANDYFNEAFGEWRKKGWFYKYAQSFIDHKQYSLAEEKYSQLLGWYPDERDAVLDYARLEFKTLGKYPEAEKLLNDLLFDKLGDYEARLMLGDTYMEWAREIDPSKYEDARFNYAKLIEQYGGKDELLFRMMLYFIRTDNYTEAMNLYEAFDKNEKAKIEPEIYAELAGYLIDNGRLEDVREILMKARSVNEEIPEIHYELARYFNLINIPREEEKALNAAIWLFENTSPLTRTRQGKLIDAYNRYGLVLYKQEKYIDAENYFGKAASNYEEALASGQIKPEAIYGNIFSNLGDLAFYVSGDYDQALKFFEKAEQNEYSTPLLKYKKGYIHYVNEDYREALVEFYDTAEGFSVNRSLMYSTANTLFNRNDYYLSEGYYTHLIDMLNKEYSSITYLLIDEIPEHRALLENLMKVSNNLGVTKYRLYERNMDPDKKAEAMVLLSDSVEFYDKLSRNPDTLVEPDTVNLAYLNSKAVFYPVKDYRLQIYQNIPKDPDKISF